MEKLKKDKEAMMKRIIHVLIDLSLVEIVQDFTTIGEDFAIVGDVVEDLLEDVVEDLIEDVAADLIEVVMTTAINAIILFQKSKININIMRKVFPPWEIILNNKLHYHN